MKTLTTLAATALLAAGAAQAAPVTIGFDGPVDNDITNDYAGLTITKIGGGGQGPVRTWLASDIADPILNVLAHSGTNVLGLQNTAAVSAAENTAIKIVFDTAVSFVSISAKLLQLNSNAFDVSGFAFMAAYSGDLAIPANFIASEEWDIAGDSCVNTTTNICQSAWDTLSLTTATPLIKAIVLGGNSPRPNTDYYRAIFDTLTYDAGGTPVPEPATLALCGLGLIAAAAAGRRRQA